MTAPSAGAFGNSRTERTWFNPAPLLRVSIAGWIAYGMGGSGYLLMIPKIDYAAYFRTQVVADERYGDALWAMAVALPLVLAGYAAHSTRHQHPLTFSRIARRGASDMISRDSIAEAYSRIAEHIRNTPVVSLDDANFNGASVWLKLEHPQYTGSFKPRGVFNSLLGTELPPGGVVAVVVAKLSRSARCFL